MSEEITLDDILWQLEKHPIDSDYVFGCKEVKIIYDSIIKLQQENKKLKEQLKQKEEIINKAREYIYEHARIDDEYPAYIEMLLEEKNELLEILDRKE